MTETLAVALAVVAILLVAATVSISRDGRRSVERVLEMHATRMKERDTNEMRLVNRIIADNPAHVAALDREQARQDGKLAPAQRRDPIIGIDTGLG